MLQLINKLKEANIDVLVKGDDLELHFDNAEISEELLQELKENKQKLIQFLNKYSANSETNEIKAITEATNYELSDAQKRLWIVSQTEAASTAYNMPTYKNVDRIEDFESFEKALTAVVERHEILRTVFRKDENDNIKQWVLQTTEVNCRIERKDFSNETNGKTLAFAYSEEDSFKPFDLENGPLFRVSLLKVTDNHTILYYNMHHIISDGWSMDILAKDLLAYYQAFQAGKTPNLPALNIQYKDYAAWQLEQLQDESSQEDKAYWVNTFSGELPVLDLPSNQTRPAIKTFNGDSLGTYINTKTIQKLRSYATDEKGSLFTGLLATLNILFHKYTGQKDIILGTVTAGREHADLEDQIGFYVNTLALRNQVNPDTSFKDLFQNVKETTLTAYKHQMYPFDKLVEDLDLSKNLSRSPLFEVLVTLQNIGDRTAKESKETQEIKGLGTCQSKFDLSVTFEEVGEGLSLIMTYNTDVYEEKMMRQLINHFKSILETVVNTPELKIKNVEYVSKDEQNTFLNVFNNTKVAYSKDETILDFFTEQVKNNPNNTAVTFENNSLTFKELDEKSTQVANFLIVNEVKQQLVPICFDRSLEMMIAIVAVLKSANAYVPIEGNLPEKRIEYILNDSQAEYVITNSEYASLFGTVKNINLDVFEYELQETTLENVTVSQTDIAYCIYTSGTTGTPKGVLNAHEGLSNRLLWMRDDLGINSSSKLLQKTPYMFDVSVWELLMPLAVGCELVMAKPDGHKNPTYIQNIIAEKEITIVHFVPSMLGIFLEYATQVKCNSLQHIVCSGEALPAQMVRKFQELFTTTRLNNYYGPTEAGIDVTAIDLTENELENNIVSIGSPVANTQIYIVDESLNIQPIGVAGEILIGGIQVAKGYLNKPELTAEKFIESPFSEGERLYKTGDLASWSTDGSIQYIGRIDSQVKIKGNRIELGEIEAKMSSKTAIKKVVVTVLDYNNEKVIAAYFVASNTNEEVDKAVLREALSKELPFYMLPNYYIQVDEIPLSSNGKVAVKALPSINENDVIKEKYVAPSTKEEEILASVWKDVLGRDKISIKDNFYNLGGDSIKSIQIGSRLNQLGFKLGVEQMLKNPVLEDLAKYIEKNSRVIDQSMVFGEVALTPIQHFFFNDPSIPVVHHFNQTVLLKSEEAVATEVLTNCISSLVEHHDALRMVYKEEESQWTQTNNTIANKSYEIQFHDLTNTEDALKEMQRIGSEIQSTIDLENGPLFRVGHFRMIDGDRIALILHHLVVDGVSWRIILEDFTTAFEAFTQGNTPKFPLKTDAFQLWSSKLQVYASSKEMQAERRYWETVCEQEITPIPTNPEVDVTLVNYNKTVSFELGNNITELLLSKVHNVYNTEINDMLLTSLGLAVKNTFGLDKAVVKMEGHGRENIIDDVDINRTVGWFTSIYPFVVDVSYCNDEKEALVQVKEDLRKIPNKGIGYGILKYLTNGFSANMQPSIVFNYLGDFGATQEKFEDKKLNQAFENIGASIANKNGSDALLSISGMISSGELQISLDYQEGSVDSTKVQELMDNYKTYLSKLIYELSKEERTYVTPSDLTYTGLSREILKDINSENNLKDVYELSPLQQGMYYDWLSSGSSLDYFEQMVYRIKIGSFNLDTIKTAYNQLINRHDILRTEFNADYGKVLLQIVYKTITSNFEYIDLSNLTNEDAERELENIKKQEKVDGFDLHKAGQMSLKIVSMNKNTYEFVWSFHHILMDGWCVGILMKEFLLYYNAVENNTEINLPAPDKYSSYINWLSKLDLSKSLEYWNDYLKGFSQQSEIPFRTEHNYASNDRFESNDVNLILEGEVYKNVIKKSAELNVTHNTFFQGVWGYLLSKYNNTNDVVFGNIVSGRPADIEGVENMVGLFINSVPFRVKYTEQDTPNTLLGRLQSENVERDRHVFANFADIQSQSELKKDLLNHSFIYQNYPKFENLQEEEENEPKAKSSSDFEVEYEKLSQTIHYGFTIGAEPHGDSFFISFRFNKYKFDEEKIQSLAEHFKNLVIAFCNNTNELLSDISFISPEEEAKLVYEFNDVKTSYPSNSTIAELFSKQASETPKQVAVSYQDKQVSYAELEARSNQFANFLQSQCNVEKGDVVAVLLERSENLPTVILGILKAGAAYLPLDPSYPQERLDFVQTDSNFKVAVTNELLKSFLADELLSEEKQFTIESSSDDLAYIMYTSGSTGIPKAVMIPQKSVVRLVKSANYYDFSSSDKLISTGAFSFDATTFEYWGMLLNGGELIVCDQDVLLDNSTLQNEIQTRQANVMWFTAGWGNQLIDDNIEIFKGLNTVLLGGEKLSPKHIQKLRTQYPNLQIINGYGPTENTTFSLTYDIKEVSDSIPIGKPISNSSVYILNEKQQLQPIGVVGEIYLGGDGLAKGYLNDPDKTADKFVNNPFVNGETIYKSGDLGMWLPDGNVLYMGRNDNQVKIRGHRIELGEIEQVLQKQDTIAQVAVTVKTIDNDKTIVAYVLSQDETLNKEGLKGELKQVLPDYMIPNYFVKVTEMPLNANGKVDYNALPELQESDMILTEYVAPSTETETKLVDIWKNLLQLEKVGIKDNFFDVGGHSIKAIKMSHDISTVFELDVSIKNIFMYPTIEQLAAQIDIAKKQQEVITSNTKLNEIEI